MQLQQKLIDLINEKAAKEDGKVFIKTTKFMIKRLEGYLAGQHLEQDEIITYLDELFGFSTITLELPLENLELLRARATTQSIISVDEVSYIKDPTRSKRGRLNKNGESLFYASLIAPGDKSNKALTTTLREIKATGTTYILRTSSKQNEKIHVGSIGIWHCVNSNTKPYFMSDEVFTYYQTVWSYMKEKFSPNLFLSYLLTDDFFAKLLSSKQSDGLYNLTSTLSGMFLESSTMDGILYQSVAQYSEPVIAIKPTIIDTKFEHIRVCEVDVMPNNNYTTKRTASITANGSLRWENNNTNT